MSVAPVPLEPRSWLRLPRRTARLRLASLYGVLFLVSGAALVGITYVLFRRATAYKQPHFPTIPHPAAIQNLPLLNGFVRNLPTQLKSVQQQLTQDCRSWPADGTDGGDRRNHKDEWSVDAGPRSADKGPASVGPSRQSPGPVGAYPGPGRDPASCPARGRLARTSGQLGHCPRHCGRSRPAGGLARCRQNVAAHPGLSPAPPAGSPRQTCTSAWPSTVPRMSSRNSATPSMTCLGGSTRHSKRNAALSPMHPTSCALP